MQPIAIPAILLAQAATAADDPWFRRDWGVALIAIAAVAIPMIVARLLAKRLRAADMWGRIATVLVAATCGGVITWLNWPPRLGIDLNGGLILVYEVAPTGQADRPREQEDDSAAEGAGAAKPFAMDEMDKLVAAVSKRVNPGGQKEVTVRRYGFDQIEVIVPVVGGAAGDESEVDTIKTIISKQGALEFRIVADTTDARHNRYADEIKASQESGAATVIVGGQPVARWVRLNTEKFRPDPNDKTKVPDPRLYQRPDAAGGIEVLVMLDDEQVTGELLQRCSPGFDPKTTQPCVNFTFGTEGAERFGRLTAANLPDEATGAASRLGIVLDGLLESMPQLNERISSNGQITGMKQPEVDILVEVLNAGSLPRALVPEPVSEQKISPQLGEDTIRAGARAMVLATIVVLVFMLAYYRFSGLVADLAVLLNIVLVLALMISFKAAFTLAGLAGLVLSVGMAVDANVLIYERMREEADRGAAVRMAIRNGFAKAFSTILDSNLTTVITGVVLYAIGTDQLKGFAITLILGLVLNLFTAVFCSRVVFDLAERNGWLRRLNMARIFGQPNFRFVAWMPLALCLSGALIAVGGAAAWRRGSGLLDIDFTGGSSVQLEFLPERELAVADVRRLVGKDGAGLPDVAVSAVTERGGATERRYKIDSSCDAKTLQGTLANVFGDRLPKQSMEILDVAAATDGPEAGGRTATVARLRFPLRIALPALQVQIEEALAATGHEDATVELAAEKATTQAKPCERWTLRTSLDAAAAGEVLDRVATDIANEPVFQSANSIGGKVAGKTQDTAIQALAASLLLIVLYVWVRFQNVAFGLAAVVALLHDVLVAVACLALSTFVSPFLGWALVDDFKISLDVVAALLTIIGFSINDTIVIFDRLRELRGKGRFVTAEMIDKAVNQTLSRTILTSGTAFLATLILYIFGGQGIHAFAFTMLVGIVTGSYSTIYIASPIVLWLQHRFAGAAAASARRAAPA